MTYRERSTAMSAAMAAMLSVACSGDDGTGGAGAAGPSSGAGAAGQSGTIQVTISGEDAATDGFLFPRGSEVTFVDGWQITFDHVLVSIGNITLSANPDEAPSDQSQTGPVVADAAGPWVVDVHVEGSVPGAGGEGKATPIVTIDRQNRSGDVPFEADQRYAFGYELVAASDAATRIGLDGDAEAAYAEMIAGGYAVYYVGTATFAGGAGCQTSDASYDHAAIPQTVEFAIGYATPTSFINCQNQDNQGDPFPDEEYQRGISIRANQAATAQMTLHLEHAFYSDVAHEPAIWFDQMAAQLVGEPEGTVLGIDHLVGLDPTAFSDGAGDALPWRVCDGSMVPATVQMGFETGSVPVDPSKPPEQALRDYRDYSSYLLSTLGHLNGGEGLCYVRRNYPSPP
jgi:hypothetical protein